MLTNNSSEYHQEEQRLANFKIHEELISQANQYGYIELDKHINALPVLTNPIERFQNTLHKGLPSEGENTLFSSILKHELLSAEEKSKLIIILIAEKGYKPYLNKLFTHPTLEILQAPANLAVLNDLYIFAIRTENGIKLEEKNEEVIWGLLITQFFNPQNPFALLAIFLDSHLTPDQLLRFFMQFRNQLLDPHHVHSFSKELMITFYKDALARYREKMNDKFLQLLEEDFAKNCKDAPALYDIYSHANISPEKMTTRLVCWTNISEVSFDFSALRNNYKSLKPHALDYINGEEKIWERLLHSNQDNSDLLAAVVTPSGKSVKALRFLIMWFNTPNLSPVNIMNGIYAYANMDFIVAAEPIPVFSEEQFIWKVLILKHDKSTELFDLLEKRKTSSERLLNLIAHWFDYLKTDEHVINTYRFIAAKIYGQKELLGFNLRDKSRDSFMAVHGFAIRKIAERRILNLANNNDGITNPDFTKRFLLESRPNVFNRFLSPKQYAYDVYNERNPSHEYLPNAKQVLSFILKYQKEILIAVYVSSAAPLLAFTIKELDPRGKKMRSTQSSLDEAQDAYDTTAQILKDFQDQIADRKQRIVDLDRAIPGYPRFNQDAIAFQQRLNNASVTPVAILGSELQMNFVPDRDYQEVSQRNNIAWTEYYESCNEGKCKVNVTCCEVSRTRHYNLITKINHSFRNMLSGSGYSVAPLEAGHYSRALMVLPPESKVSFESPHSETGSKKSGTVTVTYAKEHQSEVKVSWLLDDKVTNTTLKVSRTTTLTNAASALLLGVLRKVDDAVVAFNATGSNYTSLQEGFRTDIPKLAAQVISVNNTLLEQSIIRDNASDIASDAREDFWSHFALWFSLLIGGPAALTLATCFLINWCRTKSEANEAALTQEDREIELIPKNQGSVTTLGMFAESKQQEQEVCLDVDADNSKKFA